MSPLSTALKAHLAAALVALALLVAPGGAAAAAHIQTFGYSATTSDGGPPSTQAGAHPWAVSTSFTFPSHDDGTGAILPDESVRNLAVDLPAGLVGDPTAVPTCSEAQLTSLTCPDTSQVGRVSLLAPSSGLPALTFPIYNMKAPAGTPALFGFFPLNVAVHMVAQVRTGSDYGISITVKDLPQTLAWTETTVTFWGVPADPGHDAERGACLTFFGPSGSTCPSQAPREPFLTNPSACSPVATATAHVDSWQASGVFDTATASNLDGGGQPVGLSGCERLPFAPTITATPSQRAAGAPSGLDVDLHVPQTDNPDGLAAATLQRAVVALPAGMSVSPSSADGLGACAPGQIRLTDTTAGDCPDSARIGTVEIDTPLLDDPLTGSIYLAKQSDNPFRSLLALYVVASGHGVVVKLAGRIDPEEGTGQLTTTFDDTPQLPFTDFKLHFKDGARAPLANPPRCGTYATRAQLTPYGGGAPVSATDRFAVDTGCATGFHPTFAAGTVNPAGGAPTSFTMDMGRTDADEELGSVAVALPPGVLGNLDTVPLCLEPAAADGTCGAASQVGTTTVGAGPGATPFHLGGRVFLTGPYNGAPFGLSIVVPALAGPFDLGTVVVRAAITVDPRTAALTVTSGPFPRILQGIPLLLRSIDVTIDRPGFMFNATNCTPGQITSTIRSTAGNMAAGASRYQAAGCAALGYAPRLGLALTGRGQTTDDKHPALVAHLATRRGDANTRQVQVKLPLSLALDPDNANGLCEPAAAAAHACPATSIVGRAKAVSILHQPLTSPIYFVRGERRDPRSGRIIKTLPKLSIPLRGEGVLIDVGASSEVIDDRLVTTFDTLPDAPLRSFDLTVDGGRHGILVVSGADLCKANQETDATFGAQNGKQLDAVVPMVTPCALGIKASGHSPSALRLTVGGLGAGRVSARGRGLVRTARTLKSATVARLQVHLTGAAKRTLARGHDVRTRVLVTFQPAGSRKKRILRKTLTLHGG